MKAEKDMTQREHVLLYMERHGSISSLTAREEIGVLDLPKRISELRNDDHIDIIGTWTRVRDRWGNLKSVKVYTLAQGQINLF